MIIINRKGSSGMGDKWSEAFIKALKDGDTERVKQIPKADLHNHFVLGGSRAPFIRERKGARDSCAGRHSGIDAGDGPLESGVYWKSILKARRFHIEAFVQAREDGVTVLEIGEDVWGAGAVLWP